jgi:hypothetical protein
MSMCPNLTSEPPMPGATLSEVMAMACRDPGFRARLVADPAATLALVGVALPARMKVRVVENSDTLIHLVLPTLAG